MGKIANPAASHTYDSHQAVLAAQGYLNEGYNWIIEPDFEKFFDTRVRFGQNNFSRRKSV